ncbi:MAG: hypothetical protein DMG71_19745, partial [Acidobacteria bacterium]
MAQARYLYPCAELCYKPSIESKINPWVEGSVPLSRTLHSTSPFPLADWEHQDAAFADAFQVLQDAIAARAFPACSVAVTHQGKLVALKALGHFTYEADAEPVSNASIFDVASLTKVIATTAITMILYERGLVDLEMPVVGIIPEFAANDPRREAVTMQMLLAHSSGLPAYEKLFLRART